MTPVGLLILASASPRRRALIARLGVPFVVIPADVPEEPLPGESAATTAARLAEAKARAIASRPRADESEGVVVAADTVVTLRGRILGKPRDEGEARSTLSALRGRAHRVITGLALLDLPSGRLDLERVVTRVTMRSYSDEEIEAYVRSGSALDKAGAYGIQDAAFGPVARIEGCYLNVVGLPLCALVRGLRRLGYALPPGPYSSGRCRCRTPQFP